MVGVDVPGTRTSPKKPVIAVGVQHIEIFETQASQIPGKLKGAQPFPRRDHSHTIEGVRHGLSLAENRNLVAAQHHMIRKVVNHIAHTDLAAARQE